MSRLDRALTPSMMASLSPVTLVRWAITPGTAPRAAASISVSTIAITVPHCAATVTVSIAIAIASRARRSAGRSIRLLPRLVSLTGTRIVQLDEVRVTGSLCR